MDVSKYFVTYANTIMTTIQRIKIKNTEILSLLFTFINFYLSIFVYYVRVKFYLVIARTYFFFTF